MSLRRRIKFFQTVRLAPFRHRGASLPTQDVAHGVGVVDWPATRSAGQGGRCRPSPGAISARPVGVLKAADGTEEANRRCAGPRKSIAITGSFISHQKTSFRPTCICRAGTVVDCTRPNTGLVMIVLAGDAKLVWLNS
jgi:hypothetical protein